MVPPKEICQQMSLCPAQKRDEFIVGDSECTWGPSHFCSSEDIAKKCNVSLIFSMKFIFASTLINFQAIKYCTEQQIGKWSI